MTEENQEPGPSTTQSASRTAATASGTAGGSFGTRCTDCTSPGVRATVAWPRTVSTSSGRVRVVAPDQGLQLQRHGGHGQHPAVRAEQLADQVQRLDMVAELLPQGDDQQIADRVPVQIALRTGSGAG